MYLDLFESKTLNAVEGYMDRLSQRQKIVSSNIANIDTPGFKTKDISFHATIDELIAKEPSGGNLRLTRERHIEDENLDPIASIVTEPKGLIERADRNNVDIDWEMMKMSETSIGYSMMTQFLRGKYHKLTNSINEGR
jgi:flagellar basal-body rod protein FlgB